MRESPISKHLQRDIDLLTDRLMALFGNVERMIQHATEVLCDCKTELVQRLHADDEYVDQTEVEIEEECLKILALHQPYASDLRQVATVLKINSDLERIADLACNIARRGGNLHEKKNFPIPDDLPEMIRLATELVRKSLDSFVELNPAMAMEVIAGDRSVDRLQLLVIDELLDLMKNDPTMIDSALHCFSATRHVERIADHAVNIAEDTIYLVNGEIVRHRHEQLL